MEKLIRDTEHCEEQSPTFLQRETFVTGVKGIKRSAYLIIVVAGREEDFNSVVRGGFLKVVAFCSKTGQQCICPAQKSSPDPRHTTT
jgi:hypothetical protein